MKKYITYITYYKGKLLPPFYIGSSYEEKVLNGYNGSVVSKKYKKIYKKEQKENKHLFRTRILSYHKTREEALEEELRLQKKHNVVKNNNYFNESYASVNGYFGRDISGKLHPMYGREHSKETKEKMSKSRIGRLAGVKKTQEHKDKIGLAHKNKVLSEETKQKIKKTFIKNNTTKGKNNGNAKVIKIFNSKNDLVYICEGNFKETCIEKNLPFRQLQESRRTGKKVFSTKNGKTIANNKGLSKFIGWYAI